MTTEIQNRDIVRDENGVMYIVRGYEPWMRGIQIPNDYVVRPRNHKWCGRFGGEYLIAWSSAGCPTYGTCINCYGSGPVGMTCVHPRCGERYLVMFANGVHDFKVTLDSQWISTLVGASHTPAMADRVQAWPTTPCTSLSLDHMQMVIRRNATHLETAEERNAFASARMMEFRNGLHEEYPERLNIIQQG